MLRLTTIVLILTTAGVAGQPEKVPYKVPEPKGWGKESIALPPGFAPDMTWKGTEEIRFAPGMFTADAKDFFSYALLFWLPEDAKIDPDTMKRELQAYYRGLAKAVLASRKKEADGAAFTLTIMDAKEKPANGPAAS